MQEIPANNEQNMNTTTDLPVKKVWIVCDPCGYDVCDDFVHAYSMLKEKVIDNMSDYTKAECINNEYGCIEIGDYTYDAYGIAEDNDIVEDVINDMLDNECIGDIDDWGDTTRSEYSDDVDITVGMAIEESNGDIHYIVDIDNCNRISDRNDMSEPTELTSVDGIDWLITVHDDGNLTASRKPTTEYYLNIVVIKGGNVQIEEMKCLGESGFNTAIVECVKNGLTMCADIYRDEKVVKAFLLNTKEN